MVLNDTKKEETKKEDDTKAIPPKKPADMNDSVSWTSFIKSIFIYFLLTLLFGLFGSNFIYLTSRGSELDMILPSDDAFYNATQFKIMKHGPENLENCHNSLPVNIMGLEDNFPYNLIRIKGTTPASELEKLTLVERLMNWFGKTVAGCFKSNRALLKGWLDIFNPEGIFGNHAFQIYIICPFTIIFGGLYALGSGYFSALFAAIGADIKVTVWGFFFLYTWGICFGLSAVMAMRLLATIMFFPMSQNWKEVSNILACNVKPLVALFGFFVCGAAYDTLDPSIAGVMGIVYLALVVVSVFRYFAKNIEF